MGTKNYYVRCEYQGEYNKKRTDNRYIEAESQKEAKEILMDWNSLFETVTNFKTTECREVNIEVKNVLTRAKVDKRKNELNNFRQDIKMGADFTGKHTSTGIKIYSFNKGAGQKKKAVEQQKAKPAIKTTNDVDWDAINKLRHNMEVDKNF